VEEIAVEDASGLVLELMTPAPSEAFSLFKVQEDGSKKEFRLRMRLLRSEETIACLREAQEYARSKGEVSKEYGDIYKEAQAVALIARALCHPNTRTLPNGTPYYPQLFTSAAQLRASFTENEISVCLNQYEVTKAKYRCMESFSPEDVDKWAARLSDTMLGPLFLGRLDSSHWPALLTCLAQRVQSLSESLGLPLPNSRDSSESPPSSSGDGTGGSMPSPHVVTSAGEKLPEDSLLSKDEADAIVKARRDAPK
jgi:hypothetical protein